MRFIVLLFCLLAVIQGHIYSSTPKVTYNYDGKPLIYHLYVSLETGLGANDYLHLIWPEQIHLSSTPTALAADKAKIKAKLISFSNNLVVSDTYVTADGGTADSNYYVTFGYEMQAGKWYEVQIYPTKDPATIPSAKLLQVRAISSISADTIVYDSNYAFAFINVEKDLSLTGGVGTMGIAVSSSSSQKNRPTSIYTITIDITPSKTQNNGGNFTLSLYYDSTQPLHNSGSGLLDFSFMGLCQSVSAGPGLAAAVLNYCEISSDLSTITFSMGQVTASQVIRISTQVKNPLFKSIRGIKGYWVEFVSGIVQENKKVVSAVSVNAIGITNLGSDRIYLLWGIQSTFVQATNLPEGMHLYTAESNTPSLIPYNSFNIGFSFTQTSPIQGRYKVVITLSSSGVLQGSLVHNFPAYQNLTVFCHFENSPLPGRIECDNVGAFIMTSYRYFISGKTFFSYGTTSPITNFGDISIVPVVYDASGNAMGVALYTPLTPGTPINLRVSKSFLDLDGALSYHDTTDFKIGNAQVISMKDDKTLSSTANAMKDFFTGTNNTIGIVPDLGTSQQLVFMIQTQLADISGATDYYQLQLFYNNKVIGFESDDLADTRGLDFVGYGPSTSDWSISYSPCYQPSTAVCEKYNNDTPTKNIQFRVNSTQQNNFYGMYRFSCGKDYSASLSCPGGCADECTMFTGYGTTLTGSSVMAMRKVTFPSNFYTSLYADENLLDFVLVFRNNGVPVSASLINSYTVVGTLLQNIKASFVNYYDYSATNYNKGTRVPMMVRIGGGVLPSESRNATVVGVFFDDNVEARTFYTQIDKSYQIGCSTGSCVYYPNENINNARNDNWLTNKRVEFYNIPPIQNEFNLLVPVTPNPSNHALPKFLTIGFFAQNYTLGGVTGLLRTLSVYRLYGAGVNAAVSGVIGSINGMVQNALTSPDADFTAPNTNGGAYLSYALNVSNIVSSPPNNTFTYGYSRAVSFGTYYGAGITITSLYYNIFASSTLAFEKPPANTADTCVIFGYTYNEIMTPGANAIRNKQSIYTVFCPIDSTINLNSADGNIVFKNPQYPNVFTNGFPLRSILTYAFSSRTGQLYDYKYEIGDITAFQRSCTTFKSPQYMPSTSGKQRSTFSIVTPQIRMDKNGYDGYPRFKVKITLPSSTVTALFTLQPACEISDPLLTCTSSNVSPLSETTYEKFFEIAYTGNDIYTITSFSLNLYGVMNPNTTFGVASNYIITIYLPQYNSDYAPFGHASASNAYSSSSAYCTCQSTFTVGITGRGQQMVFENLGFQSNMQAARAYMSLDFGASSYRETFFTTSSFLFNFGWLANPASTYNARGDFRCLIYENINNGTNTTASLSRAWKTLELSNLAAVRLSPKDEINTPNSIRYTMRCLGSGVPVSGSSTNMSLVWKDNSDDVQTAVQIAPVSYLAASNTAFTFTIDKKRFRSEGFKAYYTFKIVTGAALTQNSRFVFDFHSKINSRLDKESSVECYTRQNAVIVDAEATFTYCEFTSQRQLSVWNNLNLAAGATVYIDVFNIQQPKQTDILTGPQKKITCSIDLDDSYANGISGAQEVVESTGLGGFEPVSTAVSKISILSTSVDNSYIRTTQTLTINFDMNVANVFGSGRNLYLELPFTYSEWIKRSDTLTTGVNGSCFVGVTGSATNLATACVYISKRVLKITVSSSNAQLFTLKIKNLKSPSYLPEGKNNQYRFNLFCVTLTDEVSISHYTFADFSSPLTLINDANLVDLSWKSYSFTQVNQLISMSSLDGQALTIYTGYYSSIIELRQQTFPSNFQTTMTLNLSNYASTDFLTMGGNFQIDLGKSTAYFRLAARESLSPGLYSLQFNKAGDTGSKYTAIPPLTLVVNNKKCSLVTDTNNYLIPFGGYTLPIMIRGLQCIPISDITISLTMSSSGIVMDNDLSSRKLSKSVIDGNLYMVLKHTSANTLPVGSTVTVAFAVAGTNAAQYNTVPSITLTVVDAAAYQTLPVATSLSAPSLTTNMATFRLQCSQASTIYWGLGIYPSILNSQALDFQARIISPGAGLTSNFTQTDDYYKRVYGINAVSTMQVLTKTLYNLKSNTNYIFKYFCRNQMGLISDSQSVNFTSLNYGAYLMKVAITFRNSISYGQYHDLSCSLAESFKIPYERVMTEAMSYCNRKSYIFYSNDSSKIANEADSSGEYIYNFYILPDYSIPADTTNVDIRNSLSLHSFTSTIITKTSNYLALPELVQMQTEDIQVFSVPTLTVQAPIAGLNSIVITASITNMNGFIVVGVMNGVFDNKTMTLPTTNNIKKGLFQDNTALLAARMQYATQNYNITFEFGGLVDNKEFTLFYFATSQDPTFLATSSDVKTVNAKTLEALTVNINWAKTVTVSLGLLLIFLISV